ncbi:hypothetical protein CYLTODRAFT_469676 [Cylindrobasidium torrendii FP15055 ss-10]|uniref:Uncharacterized protein n=1 Tax=Cylindrobasidium torrendii FP15055 ss-10 TaxID=1314674 RepID=A0A0D7B1J1_9AGAR|nr:hypothetical protein CYLTODRAFT_469676 [Cylindrobasidium torrendii FP15055 ss-10]
MPSSTEVLSKLFTQDGVTKNDPVYISRMEHLLSRQSSLEDFLSSIQPHKDQYSFITQRLEVCLREAQILPWQDDFDAWWNSPVIRIGHFCLCICRRLVPGLGSSVGDGTNVLPPVFINWVSLLVEPIVQIGNEKRYDSFTLENFVYILDTWASTLQNITTDSIDSIFPRLFHTIARLAIATAVAEHHANDAIASGCYAALYRLLWHFNHSYPSTDSRAAFSERLNCLADAIIRTMIWMVGTSVGKDSQNIRAGFTWMAEFLACVSKNKDLYYALLEADITTILARTLRKLVRAEVETCINIHDNLCLVLFMLEELIWDPAQMRKALEAHLALSILRLPGILSVVPARSHTGCTRTRDLHPPTMAVLLGLRIASLTIFPTFRPLLRTSVKFIDLAIERGDIRFGGEQPGVWLQLQETYTYLRQNLNLQETRGASLRLTMFRPLCNRDRQALIKGARELLSTDAGFRVRAALQESEPVVEYTTDSPRPVLVIDFCPAVSIKADINDPALRATRVEYKVEAFSDWIKGLQNMIYYVGETPEDVVELVNHQRAGGILVAYMFGDWVYHMSGKDELE